MGKIINLFMWGYQEHFRIELQVRAERVLEKIGCSLKPEALLVGIKTPESDAVHPVCVEPEKGKWDPSIFFDCARRADEIFKTHPDQHILYGDEPRTRDKPENIRLKSAREAITEVLREYDSRHNTISFCGYPIRLGDYFVTAILQFDRPDYELYPSLEDAITWNDYRPSERGLLDCLIYRVLRNASRDLVQKDPGRFFGTLLTDPTTILRESGKNLCIAISMSTQDILMTDAFDNLNSVSELFYEGSSAEGTLIFEPKDMNEYPTTIDFKEPVSLRESKLVRKLIEMSSNEFVCLYRGEQGIVGFSRTDSFSNEGFRVEFRGHYKWHLYYGDNHLMSSSYGIPHLPPRKLDKKKCISLMMRLFDRIEDEHIERLWCIVEASVLQKHGTLIVISDKAREEANRFKKQCIRLSPCLLSPDDVQLLSNIDGAILLDPSGLCHAVGVILDGAASNKADRARGARFNSALRYTEANPKGTLCLVVSEDGWVDLLPDLQPQIKRSEIKRQIKLLASNQADVAHKAKMWLDDHRFYLAQDECDIVNQRIRNISKDDSQIEIVITEFTVNQEMNEGYYLPEDNE